MESGVGLDRCKCRLASIELPAPGKEWGCQSESEHVERLEKWAESDCVHTRSTIAASDRVVRSRHPLSPQAPSIPHPWSGEHTHKAAAVPGVLQ